RPEIADVRTRLVERCQVPPGLTQRAGAGHDLLCAPVQQQPTADGGGSRSRREAALTAVLRVIDPAALGHLGRRASGALAAELLAPCVDLLLLVGLSRVTLRNPTDAGGHQPEVGRPQPATTA